MNIKGKDNLTPSSATRQPDQRDTKLTATFNTFQRRPALIAAHVA